MRIRVWHGIAATKEREFYKRNMARQQSKAANQTLLTAQAVEEATLSLQAGWRMRSCFLDR